MGLSPHSDGEFHCSSSRSASRSARSRISSRAATHESTSTFPVILMDRLAKPSPLVPVSRRVAPTPRDARCVAISRARVRIAHEAFAISRRQLWAPRGVVRLRLGWSPTPGSHHLGGICDRDIQVHVDLADAMKAHFAGDPCLIPHQKLVTHQQLEYARTTP